MPTWLKIHLFIGFVAWIALTAGLDGENIEDLTVRGGRREAVLRNLGVWLLWPLWIAVILCWAVGSLVAAGIGRARQMRAADVAPRRPGLPPFSAAAERILARPWYLRLAWQFVDAVRGHAAPLPDRGGVFCSRCGRRVTP